MDIDKSTMIQLREEIDALRTQLQKTSMHIEDLIRENTAMKRMSDARAGEIQNLRYEIKSVEGKNERAAEENRGLAVTVKGLKDERKRLEDECDGLSALLDGNISKLKALEKQSRNSESTNARLEKTLVQASNDNEKLVTELKMRNEDAKKAENKMKSLQNHVNELKITYENIAQQAEKNKGDAGNNAGNLEMEINKGKELSNNLSGVEAAIRAQENELDLIISEEEKQRKEHFLGIDRNKTLNEEVDRLLALIAEYEHVNKELLDEVEIYIDQDEQARAILNRR